jgi:pyridoxamine 5'-phosphate oxidase
VRVVGRTVQTSRERSTEYFRTRPLGSRIGAWASPQSHSITSRDELSRRVAEVTAHLDPEDRGVDEPPANWGGYRLVPDEMEFWAGKPNRLHERVQYQRIDTRQWSAVLLAP